jgi:hypothetical protein
MRERAFGTMSDAGAQVVIIQGLFEPHGTTLIYLATRHHMALMSGTRETTALGGLVSLSSN